MKKKRRGKEAKERRGEAEEMQSRGRREAEERTDSGRRLGTRK